MTYYSLLVAISTHEFICRQKLDVDAV